MYIPAPRKITPTINARYHGESDTPRLIPTIDKISNNPTTARIIPINLTIIFDKLIFTSPPFFLISF